MPKMRDAEVLDLAVLPRNAGEAKQAWVYRNIRQAILGGSLQRGARLASTRSLAARWAVSRGIVELAFDQLRLEGYISSRVGSGSRVSARLPEEFSLQEISHPGAQSIAPPTAVAPPTRVVAGLPVVARLGDPALFPLDEWRSHVSRALRSLSAQQLGDDDPCGDLALRGEIAAYLRATRGIRCDAGQLMIVTGIRQAIDLTARVVLREQGRVLLEDPAYLSAVPLFSLSSPRISAVPVDEEGISMDGICQHADAALVYVTPAHQAPLGLTMSVSRRLALLDWAQAHGAWILEDDYDSEFNYSRAPLPALKALDNGDRVIHCGSFNKSLYASLRIGYVVMPDALLPALRQLRATTGRSNSLVEQLALASFIRSGALSRHLRVSRNVYLRRRDIVLAELRAVLGERLRVSGEHAGFHFVLWLPDGISEHDVVQACAGAKLTLQGLGEFCRERAMPPALVIGYAAAQDDVLRDAASRLAREIAALAQAGGTNSVASSSNPAILR
ncbi:MocR-like pyridoxine biosynthesis transcription factor PdxR [Cupriavidus basilensis]|uniref:MocR-like pyridoxine biosynthesis transcription factor PdxR n=1 Tax=Cupriavidus basilensis TaxID=68895 RepID=UPI00284E2F94|nr:PLP-dependent aminotransferase family protein [Cupriavidus basilensis]MDR3383162.1 PLP-dependent aminotransferase family protein [Cupriavidus basilensis]